MNKILQIVTAGIFLLTSQSLFAQVPTPVLSISFSNYTGSDIQFIPLISGTVDFSNMKKNVIESDIGHARTSIKIQKVTRDSVINLIQNDQPVARLTLVPVVNTKRVVVCFEPISVRDRTAGLKQPYGYKLKMQMALQEAYQNSFSAQCADWDGVQPDAVILDIDVL